MAGHSDHYRMERGFDVGCHFVAQRFQYPPFQKKNKIYLSKNKFLARVLFYY
jgi:hypothetical protein